MEIRQKMVNDFPARFSAVVPRKFSCPFFYQSADKYLACRQLLLVNVIFILIIDADIIVKGFSLFNKSSHIVTNKKVIKYYLNLLL